VPHVHGMDVIVEDRQGPKSDPRLFDVTGLWRKICWMGTQSAA